MSEWIYERVCEGTAWCEKWIMRGWNKESGERTEEKTFNTPKKKVKCPRERSNKACKRGKDSFLLLFPADTCGWHYSCPDRQFTRLEAKQTLRPLKLLHEGQAQPLCPPSQSRAAARKKKWARSHTSSLPLPFGVTCKSIHKKKKCTMCGVFSWHKNGQK